MATPYLVIRLVPDAPVDGATFSTYLQDLQIKILQADSKTVLGSTPPNPAPVILAPIPGTSNFLGTVSRPTTSDTPQKSKNDYGNTLSFNDTVGIAVGSFLFNPAKQDFSPIPQLQSAAPPQLRSPSIMS